jgi:hypothetical protein
MVEELKADAVELVTARKANGLLPGGGKILADELGGERSHRQIDSGDTAPYIAAFVGQRGAIAKSW